MEDLDLLGAEYVGGPAQDAIAAGNRDENALTDLEFAARHPERIMLRDPKIQPGESALAKEWMTIREEVVRPALAKVQAKAAPRASVPAPSSLAPAPPSVALEADKKLTRNDVIAACLGVLALLGIGVAITR